MKQVVWYFHLFQNFPQFVVIHTVKGFGVDNEEEVDVFLELSCFFDDPTDIGNLISCSSAFSKSSLNILEAHLCAHLCMKCSLVSLIFMKRSLVFPILLFSSISLHCLEGLLISPCWSLELCIQLGISFPFSLAIHFSSFLSYL